MDESRSLAERMMDGKSAESVIEDGMIEAGMEHWDGLGCDWYDMSIEVNGIPPEHPMSAAVAAYLLGEAGFSKVYANQTDGWEIHFNGTSPEGWHRRWAKDETSQHDRVIAGPTPDRGYWEVSAFPASWPTTWLENGYVRVVDRTAVVAA